MDERERQDKGMTRRRKVLGDKWVDRSIANKNDFNAEFQDLITRYAWGEIWTRPGLERHTRSCMTLCMMVALGHWEEGAEASCPDPAPVQSAGHSDQQEDLGSVLRG
jgi:4-carboxymuconolactone decarboxylase